MNGPTTWQDWATLGGGVGGIFTAVAAIVAAWQLLHMQRQSTTSFEDALAREYRELAATDFPGVTILVDGRRITDPDRWQGVRRIVIGG